MATEFLMKRRVQFAETDMAGVLHFANYYRFMEEVEHAFWRSKGASVMTKHKGHELGWPRVATSCDYFEPIKFEQEVELALRVKSVGEQAVTYEVEFRRERRRIALGRATAVCCAISEGSFQPLAIPDSLRSKLEDAVEP